MGNIKYGSASPYSALVRTWLLLSEGFTFVFNDYGIMKSIKIDRHESKTSLTPWIKYSLTYTVSLLWYIQYFLKMHLC